MKISHLDIFGRRDIRCDPAVVFSQIRNFVCHVTFMEGRMPILFLAGILSICLKITGTRYNLRLQREVKEITVIVLSVLL